MKMNKETIKSKLRELQENEEYELIEETVTGLPDSLIDDDILNVLCSAYFNLDEYKKAIELQMEKDISSKTDFIHSILKKYGLDRHSIYLYFLPFNDPETDKGTIIDSLVSGGF